MSENYFAPRDEHGCATNIHFLNASRFAFHAEIDTARAVDEITLFDYEFISAVLGLEGQSTVMNQVSAQRSTGTARRGIFRNVVGRREEARVRTRRADFDRLTCERMTTRPTMTSVNFGKQLGVDTNVA